MSLIMAIFFLKHAIICILCTLCNSIKHPYILIVSCHNYISYFIHNYILLSKYTRFFKSLLVNTSALTEKSLHSVYEYPPIMQKNSALAAKVNTLWLLLAKSNSHTSL